MSNQRPITMRRLLQLGEVVALATTVVALVATVVAVGSAPGVYEANPVTRHISRAAGWSVAGAMGVLTLSGIFTLYHHLRNTAPRVVLVGSVLVVATSVADMLVTMAVGLSVQLTWAGVRVMAVPMVVTTGTAVLVYLLRQHGRCLFDWLLRSGLSEPSR